MQVKLTNDGEIQFLDGDHLNRNSLNRKTLVVNPETALATRESLWVQFGDSQNFENVNANILEPIRLSEEEEGYKTIFPDEVVKNAGTWYMTLAVRMYSTDGTTFSEQLTSDKVSFAVNDSYPMDDDGYISNGTLENAWQQIKGAVQDAEDSASNAEQAATAAQTAQQAAEAAQAAAEAAQEAAETAEDNAKASETAAQGYANAASSSAGDAASSAEQAADSETAAGQSASAAASSATQAAQSASAASGSAQSAQESADRAQEIVDGIGSVYKPVGSIPYEQLPATPSETERGYVYNITDSFTTDARFVEGAGKSYPAGSNVAVVLSGAEYKYDVLSGNVDLSNYAQINGTYPNMNVGNATNAGNAASADSADKVANSLTINIDGEPITFDGSAARTVDINTTSSTDPEAVHFTEQALTSEQQTQARENIGAAGTSGSYPNMTVGNATHADSADSAAKATQDGNGDNIAATYAKQNGTYPNLTAGEAKGLSKVGSVYADSASRVGWHKFAEVPLSALTAVAGASSYSAIVLVNGLNPYQGGDTANSGIVEVDMRVDGSQFASSTPPQIKLLSGNVDIQKLCFKRTDTEVGLYINTSSIYVRYSFTVLDERYYLGRSVDAMEFADEYYGAAAPDGAVYATNVNQAAYAQEAAMLDEAYKAGNSSGTSLNGYVKLIDFTAGNNWAEKTMRLEFGDDNASNVPQNPCGMEIRVQWNSSDGVSPRAVLLYGDKQIADKLYVSYNPSFTEGEENTVSVYYKVSGGYDMVAYKPLYMTPRQGTDVTGVIFYQPTQSDLIAELPSGNTNTAITALENFRDLRYAKYDADGNDISDTYATKSDLNAGLQRLYPIGSIYFSAVGTNPSELFGFGTWQAWGAGRVAVGVDASQTEFNAVEKTGGEKAHALTINEMPSHTHEISYRPIGDPSDDPFALFKSEGGITGTYNSPGTELSQDALEAKAAGGGQAHNNLQPYITCYMWKRTA